MTWFDGVLRRPPLGLNMTAQRRRDLLLSGTLMFDSVLDQHGEEAAQPVFGVEAGVEVDPLHPQFRSSPAGVLRSLSASLVFHISLSRYPRRRQNRPDAPDLRSSCPANPRAAGLSFSSRSFELPLTCVLLQVCHRPPVRGRVGAHRQRRSWVGSDSGPPPPYNKGIGPPVMANGQAGHGVGPRLRGTWKPSSKPSRARICRPPGVRNASR